MLAMERQKGFACIPMNAKPFVSTSSTLVGASSPLPSSPEAEREWARRKWIAAPVTVLLACLLAAGCQKNQPAPSASAAAPQNAKIVSAEKTSFDEVTAKLNPGGNLFVYLSTEQTLRGLTNRISAISNFASSIPSIPPDGRATIGRVLGALDEIAVNSGIAEIRGIGMSSIAREPGFYYGKVVVYHDEGQSHGVIWSLFGSAPHTLELDLLPASTAMAFFSDFDLTMAWTNVNKIVDGLGVPPVADALRRAPVEFHKQTGLEWGDVLDSLSGAYGIIFTLDPTTKVKVPIPGNMMEVPSPGLAFVIKVNSDLIFNRVDEALKDNPLVTKVDDTDLRMRTMNIPLPISFLRPTLARFGDYLVLASSDTLAREIVAVKSGQNKGFKGTDEFKKLSQDIPDKGNNFALVTSAFASTIIQVHQQFASQAAAGGHGFPEFFDGQTNSFSYSVGVNGPQGWEGFANGNHNMQALVVPAAVAAGTAAAIAIPNFVKAREAAQQKGNKT